MAKELPYFKFEPGAWDSGNIQMCSRESKGLFVDLCSLYWSRLGEVPYALALQKLCNSNRLALQELEKYEIIVIKDDQITIEFLDEQLLERGVVSEKRREAAQKRWSDANALQMQSKSNAKRREEKRVEEKKKEEKIGAGVIDFPFELTSPLGIAWLEWEQFRFEKKQKLVPSTILRQLKFLGGRPDSEAIAIIDQSIKNGWTGLFELKNNGTNQRRGKRNQGTALGADAVFGPQDCGEL